MVSTDNEQTKKPKKFMSRNVTEFRHLLKMSYINENDLNWMIGLRENPPAQSLSKNCSPPEVYSKKTKLFEIREVNRLKDKPHLINGHSFGHMLLKKGEKIGGKHTEDQL